jgi:hypothetical protein
MSPGMMEPQKANAVIQQPPVKKTKQSNMSSVFAESMNMGRRDENTAPQK